MRRFLIRRLALTMLVPMVTALAVLVMAGLAPGTVAAQAAAQPTPTEVTYFADTAPFRANLVRNQQWLENIVKAMQTGHADEVTTNELSNLSRELYAAKRGFADAEASERLWDYDRLVKASLDRSYTAAVMLLHAQVTDSGPDHDALVRDAAIYTASGGKMMNDAANALVATSLPAQ